LRRFSESLKFISSLLDSADSRLPVTGDDLEVNKLECGDPLVPSDSSLLLFLLEKTLEDEIPLLIGRPDTDEVN